MNSTTRGLIRNADRRGALSSASSPNPSGELARPFGRRPEPRDEGAPRAPPRARGRRAPLRPPRPPTPWPPRSCADALVAVAPRPRAPPPGRRRTARRRRSRRARASRARRRAVRRRSRPGPAARRAPAASGRGAASARAASSIGSVSAIAALYGERRSPSRFFGSTASSSSSTGVDLGRHLALRQEPRRDHLRRPAPAPGSRCRIACTTSGCSCRNAVAFWRPCPRRSSPKEKYEPDFWTTFLLEADLEHRALPGDAVAVDDVELGLLERRRDLVLHHLHAHAVADRLDAFLQRLDAADVEPHRRVEAERAAARRSSPGCRT